MEQEKQQKRNLSIYLDEQLIDQLTQEATASNRSRNEVIADLLKGSSLGGGSRPQADDRPMVLVLSSHKGGVAKTITAANLAVEFALKGRKTLLVDLDGQGSASEYLHVYDDTAESRCVADVMIVDKDGNRAALSEVKRPALYADENGVLHQIDNLEVVPSDLRFDNADSRMKNSTLAGVDTRLRDAIDELVSQESYDYVIIDCPPRVDLVTTNAITALEAGKPQSMVIIPVRPDGFSKRGMESTVSAVKAVSRAKKSSTANWVLLRTIDEPRTNLSKILDDVVAEDFPEARFLQTRIEKAVVVMESSQFFTPLAFYAENVKSRSQYIALAEEIEAIANGQ